VKFPYEILTQVVLTSILVAVTEITDHKCLTLNFRDGYEVIARINNDALYRCKKREFWGFCPVSSAVDYSNLFLHRMSQWWAPISCLPGGRLK